VIREVLAAVSGFKVEVFGKGIGRLVGMSHDRTLDLVNISPVIIFSSETNLCFSNYTGWS
jgi:hypothetical protein